MMNRKLVMFVLGVGAGAILAVLFAPEKDREDTRDRLAERSGWRRDTILYARPDYGLGDEFPRWKASRSDRLPGDDPTQD
jgi:hypothetical protein